MADLSNQLELVKFTQNGWEKVPAASWHRSYGQWKIDFVSMYMPKLIQNPWIKPKSGLHKFKRMDFHRVI